MDKEEIIRRLKKISKHAVHTVGELPFIIGLDDGIALDEAVRMLEEQEARELTIDEWREWKANPNRNPICELWEYDISPMWILNPNDVHEPALLIGKLKLFTGKPTFEQCKEVKWNECVR